MGSELRTSVTEVLEEMNRRHFSIPHAFRLLEQGEHHGSWTWTLYKEALGLSRFVMVAATDLFTPELYGAPSYAVEVWAGADDGTRFVRRMISTGVHAVGQGDTAVKQFVTTAV